VRGCFAAAARVLIDDIDGAERLADGLFALHRESRDDVYHRASVRFGFDPSRIGELIDAHRAARPPIVLPDEHAALLRRCRARYRLAVLTDGHEAVQRAKVAALDLDAHVDFVCVADAWGREAWKPSPRGILAICEAMSVEPEEAVLIGDNPARDMAAAAHAGVPSVRVRAPSGSFASEPDGPWPPEATISSLLELEALLLRWQVA
jgi:putative hydrolase of the HAD superfamily